VSANPNRDPHGSAIDPRSCLVFVGGSCDSRPMGSDCAVIPAWVVPGSRGRGRAPHRLRDRHRRPAGGAGSGRRRGDGDQLGDRWLAGSVETGVPMVWGDVEPPS
jgi:hypothetical protein